MPDIKDTVGVAGTNDLHDVALLQALLRVVNDAKGQPCIPGYDGIYGGQTKAAIASFQTEHGIAAKQPARNQETLGLVGAGGPTIAKLNAMLAADYKQLRIIENTRTVY